MWLGMVRFGKARNGLMNLILAVSGMVGWGLVRFGKVRYGMV